jgi:hypothetical protein
MKKKNQIDKTRASVKKLVRCYYNICDDPGTLFSIPFVWKFSYFHNQALHDYKLSLYTNNIVFACCIFEAYMLGTYKNVVTVKSANLVGLEEEFFKICDNANKDILSTEFAGAVPIGGTNQPI